MIVQIVSSQIFTCKFEEIKFKIGIEISWDWNLICFRKKEARMRFDILTWNIKMMQATY